MGVRLETWLGLVFLHIMCGSGLGLGMKFTLDREFDMALKDRVPVKIKISMGMRIVIGPRMGLS